MILGDGKEAFRLSGGEENVITSAEYYPLIAAMPHCPSPPYLLRCGVLLLWNDDAERLLPQIYAESAVSCGFAACCTLTLASMEQNRAMLTVQRELCRLDGSLVLPQDIPLRKWQPGITEEEQLVLAGLRLLRGEM